MEVVEGSKPIIGGVVDSRLNSERDQVRVKRKTLEAVLDQCQRALELLSTTGCIQDDEDDDELVDDDDEVVEDDGPSTGRRGSSPDGEADLVN